MTQKSNQEKVINVAHALKELNDIVVYVGGSVAQFYSNDPAVQDIQTTYDVDCAIDISSRKEYYNFQEKLYGKGFINDQSEGAPVCRFLHGEDIVDFMPKDGMDLTGESNKWYPYGIKHRIPHRISPSQEVFIMPVSYYLASKFEALHSRGGTDYRVSKDFEDIVFVINSCSDIVKEIQLTNEGNVIGFLKKEFEQLVLRGNIREEIECTLTEEGRTDYVMNTMKEISKIL